MKALKFYSLFLIITLFGCTEENNYYTTAKGLGKVNVYIEGDITNAEAHAQLEEEVGILTENIFIQNTSQLTNLNISVPIYIRKILFSNCESLLNISISGQGAMPITEISIGGSNTQNITINGITELNNFNVSGATNNATYFIANDLIKINNTFGFNFNHLHENSAKLNDLEYVNSSPAFYSGIDGKFTILEFNALKELPNAEFNVTINELNLPSLQKANSLTFGYYGYLGINTINFPSLINCESIYLRDDNAPAVTVNMPLLNYCKTYQSRIGLDSTGINAILHQFLTIQPISGKSLFFEDSAQPTGQGLIDKQTLINQGNTVTIY